MARRGAGGFRDLLVWQKAMDAVDQIYAATRAFPKDEMFGLTSQLRRAANSIPMNVSEGYKRRKYKKDFLRFLIMAHGSNGEVETALEIAVRQGFLAKPAGRDLWRRYDEISRMLSGLIAKLEGNEDGRAD